MALVHIEGFDLPAVDSVPGILQWSNASGSGRSWTMQAGRSGGRCLRIAAATLSNTAETYGGGVYVPVTPSVAAFAVGVAWRRNTLLDLDEKTVLAAGNQTGGGYRHLTVTYEVSSSTWRVRRGNATGTVLASGVFPITANAWLFVELAGVIASGTGGSFSLRVNETTVASASGVNTLGSTTVNTVVNMLTFGSFEGYGGTRWSEYDDLYFRDDAVPMGNRVVRTIRPNAPGAASAWAVTGAATGWQATSDDADASYVQAGTVGTRDLYDLGTPNLDTVDGVQVQGKVSKSTEGTPPGGILSALRGDGGAVTTPLLATAGVLTTTPTWQQGAVQTLDPDGDAWTPAGVDALQAGPQVG